MFSTFRRATLVLPAVLLAAPAASYAADHTWQAAPRMRILSAGVTTVDQVVEITGSRINWGTGFFNTSFFELSGVIQAEMAGTYWAYGQALVVAARITVSFSSVCQNPFVSAATKNTTSQSDTIDRYLAAVDMYKVFLAKNLWNAYRNNAPINIIINGKTYQGFSVTYKDGAQETWVVFPDPRASVKLFDTPAPDSQKPPGTGPSC